MLAGQYMPEWKALEGLREKYPDQVTCITLDVGNTESVKDAVRRTADICGKVDILVNCAGIIRDDTREGFRSKMCIRDSPLPVPAEIYYCRCGCRCSEVLIMS